MYIEPEHFSSNEYDDIVWCPVSGGWEIFYTNTSDTGPGGDICDNCGALLYSVKDLRKANQPPPIDS